MKKTALQLLSVFIILTIGAVIGWFAKPKCAQIVKIRVDTLVKIDTLRDTVRVPVTRYIARVDTVWLPVVEPPERGSDPDFGDSVRVTVPIERKIYQTDDYRAEIEGFRPSLVSMEVYRQTQYINTVQTVKVPDMRRWSVGIQAGYGATIQNGRIVAVPTVGVGVQYSIFKW